MLAAEDPLWLATSTKAAHKGRARSQAEDGTQRVLPLTSEFLDPSSTCEAKTPFAQMGVTDYISAVGHRHLSLADRFKRLHRAFCNIGEDGLPLEDLVAAFAVLSREALSSIPQGRLNYSEVASIRQYTLAIQTLAGAAMKAVLITTSSQSRLSAEVASVLKDASVGSDQHLNMAVAPDTFRPWKDWFVENMDNPYATDREAASLAALIPGQNAQQFRTWLTNNRRRSGWTTLFKEHAESSKDRMRLLMSQYEDEHLSQLMPPEMYDAITEVKNYHKKLDEGRSLSGAIKKVVEEHGHITPVKKRRVRANTSGSENEGSPPESCASVSLRSSSGSSTSSPYSFEGAPTPAPMTGKRAREEGTDYAESPSSSKRTKSSLYDTRNRPIAGLRAQQPADLSVYFTLQAAIADRPGQIHRPTAAVVRIAGHSSSSRLQQYHVYSPIYSSPCHSTGNPTTADLPDFQPTSYRNPDSVSGYTKSGAHADVEATVPG